MDHFTLKKLNAEFEEKLNPIVKQIIEFCDFYYERDKIKLNIKIPTIIGCWKSFIMKLWINYTIEKPKD